MENQNFSALKIAHAPKEDASRSLLNLEFSKFR